MIRRIFEDGVGYRIVDTSNRDDDESEKEYAGQRLVARRIERAARRAAARKSKPTAAQLVAKYRQKIVENKTLQRDEEGA